MQNFLGGPEGFLDYMAAALNSASPEESFSNPNCEREVFLPLERPSLLPPFFFPRSLTSSIVASIILLLANVVASPRPPNPSAQTLRWRQRGAVGNLPARALTQAPASMCGCCFHCAVGFQRVPLRLNSLFCLLAVQTWTSARSSGARRAAAGTARTPSAPIGASPAASQASREKTPPTAVSRQNHKQFVAVFPWPLELRRNPNTAVQNWSWKHLDFQKLLKYG